MSEYMTMREMARLLDSTTSNRIGRILKQLGLRASDGTPTAMARQLRLVSQRPVYWNNNWTVTTWHFERTLPFLLQAGLTLRD